MVIYSCLTDALNGRDIGTRAATGDKIFYGRPKLKSFKILSRSSELKYNYKRTYPFPDLSSYYSYSSQGTSGMGAGTDQDDQVSFTVTSLERLKILHIWSNTGFSSRPTEIPSPDPEQLSNTATSPSVGTATSISRGACMPESLMSSIQKPWGVKRRACVNCTVGKAKCSPHSDDICERCHRLGKQCVYLNVADKRKSPGSNT
jgi:hypothetical protein